jgi:hypothetical protein
MACKALPVVMNLHNQELKDFAALRDYLQARPAGSSSALDIRISNALKYIPAPLERSTPYRNKGPQLTRMQSSAAGNPTLAAVSQNEMLQLIQAAEQAVTRREQNMNTPEYPEMYLRATRFMRSTLAVLLKHLESIPFSTVDKGKEKLSFSTTIEAILLIVMHVLQTQPVDTPL